MKKTVIDEIKKGTIVPTKFQVKNEYDYETINCQSLEEGKKILEKVLKNEYLRQKHKNQYYLDCVNKVDNLVYTVLYIKEDKIQEFSFVEQK